MIDRLCNYFRKKVMGSRHGGRHGGRHVVCLVLYGIDHNDRITDQRSLYIGVGVYSDSDLL